MASIEKRGTNSWRLIVEAGYKPDGSRDKRTTTIKVEDKALLKTTKRLQEYLDDELKKFKFAVESGEYIAPAKMTFAEFVENEWKPKYAEDVDNLSPKSLINYEGHLKNHILPAIGHLRIDEIKTIRLVNMMDKIKKPGGRIDDRGDQLGPGTVRYIHRVAKNVFSRAQEWGLIKENPMNGVPKPSQKKGAERYYDEEEAQAVIKALYTHAATKWRLYFVGALVGGFRRGELTALQWSDVMFEQRAIRIDESISLTKKGKAVVGKPKTAESKAIVDMPEWYMNELRAYKDIWQSEKKDAGDKWIGGDNLYVFHGGLGKPYYYTYPSNNWRLFVEKHGLKNIPLHGLRHTTATILLEQETDTRIIQERLRHTQHSTTTGLYAHVTKKLSRVAASKFDKFNPRQQPTESSTENPVPNPSPTPFSQTEETLLQ